MRRIAMLLCDADNPYERALAETALAVARERGAELLPPHYAAMSSVSQLSARIGAVVCQDDAMALGVRNALVQEASRAGRPELLGVPLTGVDGVPEDGQRRVREGSLAATVVMPLTSAPAVHALCDFWTGGHRAGRLVMPAEPYPELDRLAPAP